MRCAFPVNRVQALLPAPVLQSLRSIPHALFSLLYPDDCRLCHEPLSGITPYPVCRSCIDSIQPLEAEYFCALCRTPFASARSLDESGRCALCVESTRGFDAAYSLGAYDGPLRDLIHLFKYRRIMSLDRPLGKLLVSALPRDEAIDLIVPVPMHWTRRWTRGFNQSERLSRAVSRAFCLPVSLTLKRTRRTSPQAGLSHAERQDNLSAAFSVRRRAAVAGKRVLLVDDVFTTGATAAACSRELKRAGARSVVLLTLARVDRRWTEIPDR